MTGTLSLHYKKQKLCAPTVFLISLITAAILFVPFIIMGGGVFYYYGDFNVQEIPFYQLAHDAVRSGEIGWSHITDLGSDFLSSYSFYLLGSPFFWLTIPFPSEAVPYLIGPILILKFAFASLSAYIYLKRYVRNKYSAVIGGLLYAFSGFSIYNVFFFHFHEPMIIFPLLLAALDSFIYDKRRAVFAVAVFSACVINYYFFVGQVLFVIMYFLVITLSKTYKFKIREFLILALEALIGFFGAAFILLPSVMGLVGNPRLEQLPNGWDALVYSRPQRYWLIIISFFFPPDMPAFPVFTPDSNCKWASVAGWLPLFSMTGVIAFLQTNGKNPLKRIIMLLMLFAFVPVLNSMFQMFNSSIFYARWYYMIVLMLALATIKAIENRAADWNRAIRWTVGITAGITLLVGLMPKITTDDNGAESVSIGVEATPERYWLYVVTAFISLLALVLIIKKFRRNIIKFTAVSALGIVLVSLVSSAFTVGTGYAVSSTTLPIKNDILNKRSGITVEDIDSVRSDFYECTDNTAMFWQLQSINCFQSSVSTSIMQFYSALAIERDVASRPNTDAYGLRPFLSCKYLFDYRADGKAGSDASFIDENGETKMPGWEYMRTENGFDIYKNENYIPMGFTYSDFITEEEFERTDSVHKSEAVLYSLVLNRELMKKYSSITGYSDEKYKLLYSDRPEHFDSIADKYKYDYESVRGQCRERAKSSCCEFEYTKTGFRAKYDNTGGSENLLFFTVPYSDGFSATVNGERADVEKVCYGFTAVKIPADTKCDVVFSYQTPGWSAGVIISLISLAAFAVYVITTAVLRARTKRKIQSIELF